MRKYDYLGMLSGFIKFLGVIVWIAAIGIIIFVLGNEVNLFLRIILGLIGAFVTSFFLFANAELIILFVNIASDVESIKECKQVKEKPIFNKTENVQQKIIKNTIKEDKTEVDLILSNYGSKKIQTIKVVRDITKLGLKETKELVDNAPKLIKRNITKTEANAIKIKLEEVGASVKIVFSSSEPNKKKVFVKKQLKKKIKGWKCTKCGEYVEDHFEICWNCETKRDNSMPTVLFEDNE